MVAKLPQSHLNGIELLVAIGISLLVLLNPLIEVRVLGFSLCQLRLVMSACRVSNELNGSNACTYSFWLARSSLVKS